MTQKEVEQWIESWVNLYPENVKWNGVAIKSTVKDCLPRMVKFCKNNPTISKENIFNATKKYLAIQEAKNWEYTRRAKYFIEKQGEGSMLLEFCNELSKDTNEQENDILISFYNDFI